MSDTKGFRLRRLTAALLCMVLLISSFSGAQAAVIEYTVTASRVNLRKDTNTSSAIVAVIRMGDTLTLMSTDESGWLKVSTADGTEGYISGDYACLTDLRGEDATALVLAEKLNVRSAPSANSRVLIIARKGSILQVLALADGWLKVSFGGYTGYVSPQYVSLDPGASAAPTAAPQVTGAPAMPSVPDTTEAIEKGDRGEQVRTLQLKLIDLGYLTGRADGIFGTGTENAVKAFQRERGLTISGKADAATLAALNTAAATPIPTPVPTPISTPAPTVSTNKTLSQGSRGDAVKQLQQKLLDLGYLTGRADGIFGAGTTNAVKSFQREHGLTADGKAGPATLAALNAAAATPAPTPVPTPTPTPVPTAAPTVAVTTVLQKGDRGEAVKEVQEKLIALGYLSGRADGIFGSDTRDAVKAFQRNEGIDDDGKVGTETLAALTAANGVPANPVQPDTNRPITNQLLKYGSSGDAVRQLQEKLIQLGYMSGTATGYFGSETREAVKAFQRDKNLTVDGMAGTSTLSALSEASGSTDSNPTGVRLLKYGDSGEAVKILQTRLKELGYFSGAIGGNFGTLTRDAVAAFQIAAGLTSDGMAGEETLNAVFAEDAPKQEDTSLRVGDSGDGVTDLQNRLKELGYLTGAVDGKFGSGTQGAVMAFQTAAGLTADGVAGPTTLNKLYAADAPMAPTPSVPDDTVSPVAAKIIATAKKYLGCKYVYACEDPPYFDCSGLTQYVFKQYGYSLLRTAQQQGYNDKYLKLTHSQLKPGDLVFFNTNLTDADMCDHTGIYMGNGDFIHASSSAGKVVISNLNSGYYLQRFSWGRRILDQ